MASTATSVSSAVAAPCIVPLRVTELTPESFASFGQVIDPQPDGSRFGPLDAQLDLSRGIPRWVLVPPVLLSWVSDWSWLCWVAIGCYAIRPCVAWCSFSLPFVGR